jgi:phage FluMu gp28-like protein
MKKFKNLENYTEATQYIQNIFDVPVSQMKIAEEQEEEVIAKIIWLFDNAKNSAVRAAIHHHALGSGVYLDTSEEREISKYVHYKGMFCEYFNQSRHYAQIKRYDGSNVTLRYLTEVDTYIVDDAGEEHFIQNNHLKKYLE